jgi:hypothetical protein
MNTPQTPANATRTGGIAAWSIHHPIGVTMITLALVVLGFVFSLRLPVDLLPNIVYPEVRVRILDPGVSARIMEDQVTRPLEEQLAITENVVSLISTSKEGEGSVDMLFPYGTDIDIALRDASNRLDRARRALPTSIEPPIIFKSDPQQIPVAEFIVSSTQLDPVQLRSFIDYNLSKWFINLPGVAATEVGGGLIREIQVLPDLERLAASGLTGDDLVERLREANRDVAAGRLYAGTREYSSRTAGRFQSVEDIRTLPILIPGGNSLPLHELAEVRDTHADERLRVRFNGTAGVKLTIQKQPTANAVAVVETVMERLQWLQDNRQLPADIRIDTVSDQSIYVRYALNNAALAGLSGAALAMAVVFLFLGDVRRTLVIGTAIPIAIAVTLFMMEFTGLTLNIMSLGGLAVGIGMLVDSSIVMLENIHRHQHEGEDATSCRAVRGSRGQQSDRRLHQHQSRGGAAVPDDLGVVRSAVPGADHHRVGGHFCGHAGGADPGPGLGRASAGAPQQQCLASGFRPPAGAAATRLCVPARLARRTQKRPDPRGARLHCAAGLDSAGFPHRQGNLPAGNGRRQYHHARHRRHRHGHGDHGQRRPAPGGIVRETAGGRLGVHHHRRLHLRTHRTRTLQPRHAADPAQTAGAARGLVRRMDHAHES